MKQPKATIVDLSQNISVETTIPESNHPALRSGFHGFPPNPRWNGSKYRAWRLGQQWRNAYHRGEMIVRRDRVLVIANHQGHTTP